MLECPALELVGVLEEDAERRAEVMTGGAAANGTAGPCYASVRWFESPDEMLRDESITAVACEGANDESLDMAERIIAAGKHLWLDKPAGECWAQWVRIVEGARAHRLHIQLGFMLRYSPAFTQLAEWARSGFLGQIFKVRGDMSKAFLPGAFKKYIDYPHAGGIFYDLGGHMVDMILWMYSGRRPLRATGIFHATQADAPSYADNTLGLLEFEGGGLGMIDISLREHGNHRRFELFGSKGSAIITGVRQAHVTAASVCNTCCRSDGDGGRSAMGWVGG